MNNFGLSRDYSSFSFEEVCGSDLEVVSGGSGVGMSVGDKLIVAGIATVGVGIALTPPVPPVGLSTIARGGMMISLGQLINYM